MEPQTIQALNELSACGGIIAGTIFWIFVAEVIFGNK